MTEPKTLEDYQRLRKDILNKMENKFISFSGYLRLCEDLGEVDIKIEELNSEL